MFTRLYILLIILLKSSDGYKFIKNKQWNILRNYIKDESITLSMRNKVNLILFYRHLPLVNKKVNEFKRFHFKKCKHIDKNDMLVCSYKALLDCIKKYDGSFTFYNYADKYIKGSLYKVMTEHYPISKMNKVERKKNIHKRKSVEVYQPNIYLSKKDYLRSINLVKSDSEFENIWDKIDSFHPFVKRIFRYKFDFYFNKIRSNYQVSELMCCSEEHIRSVIKKHISLIYEDINLI